jgi:cystathionine beta-synthase
MDLLVTVDDPDPPRRLQARSRRTVALDEPTLDPSLVAELRGHLPRRVGVTGPDEGAHDVARALHKVGMPVTLYTDADVAEPPEGVEVLPRTDPGPVMDVGDTLIDLIGETPLVRLDRIGEEVPGQLLAKLEMLNPGGSVKDRPAVAMIDAAEASGELQPGGTIVEGTSGNTGVGLAIAAALRGYRCIFVMADKMSDEKVSLLRAYGAEVVVCPTAVPPEHPDSYYSVTARLARETPGGYQPNQYANQENPAVHEATTGPEIWRQTAGRVTHFVAGLGTGGTITGVGRYLKEKNPDIVIVGADPPGSVYSGGEARPYLVEGIGEDFWPETYDPDVVDRIITVSDRDSFLTARATTTREGLLVGGSCGTAIHAAIEVGRDAGPDAVVVTVLPDSGRAYLSKIYDDEWMADHGFSHTGERTAGDVIARKPGDIPALVHVHPDETVRQAIAILREFGVSQLPVVKAEPPVMLAEIAGSVRDRDLLDLTFEDTGALDRPIGEIMGPALPLVGAGEPVDDVVAALAQSGAAIVVDAGQPIGVLTRSDVLDYLADRL